MTWPVSQRFLDTLASPEQKLATQISVYNGETWLADLVTPGDQHSKVQSGTINIDETQQVRRTLSPNVVIQSEGLEYDDLVPTNGNSLLHPASGNELRIFRGFVYNDGTNEMVPLGVFRLTVPEVKDTPDGIEIDVYGLDRSSVISKKGYQEPWPIAAGTPVSEAIYNLINDKMPGLTYNMVECNVPVPATTFGGKSSSSGDPFADAMKLGAIDGLELLFGATGEVVLRPVSNPATSPSVYTFSEGDSSLLTEVDRTFDETTTYNGVILTCDSGAGPPVQVQVWDNDPTSPTYYLGPWGKVPYPMTSSLIPYPGQSSSDAMAQALTMAQAQFLLVCRSLDEPSFYSIPNPLVWDGDVVTIERARIGVSANYACAQLAMPIDAKTTMQFTGRPQQQPGT